MILDALNDVRDVDVRTGDASTDNISRVLACRTEGCLDEVKLFLLSVDTVQVCDDDDCEEVSKAKFFATLKESVEENSAPDDAVDPNAEPAASSEPDTDTADDEELDDDEEETPAPTLGPPFMRRSRSERRPDPATPMPEPSPSPTPTPAAA